MKQFFKMMFASAFGVMLAAGILFTILITTLVSYVATVGSDTSYTPKENTVLKIKLDGTMADNPADNPLALLLGEEEEQVSLKDLLEAIRVAERDSRVAGIYLESGSLAAGSASLGTIREALEDFKRSGKFVVAYADNFTQGNYYLCSAADKVFMNPQGILALQGLASQTLFFKGLMSKIGVEMQIFKVGTYKGAVEPFMLDKLSDANREQIQSYLASIWGHVTEGIARSRGIPVSAINAYADQGICYSDPAKAVEYGLVDELRYKPEAEAYVKELAGQTDKRLATATPEQIKSLKPAASPNDPEIAVLYAEGEIEAHSSTDLYDMEQRITERLADELIKLKDNDDVKAVVLRVNSPGGSAYISDQIWRQVVDLKKQKPVVVSMGDVAASGGYYISCAANRIIAEPCTLTGSIGIFGMFPNAAGLLGKLAVSTDIVKTNTFADLGDLSRPMTEDEKALIQGYVERGYQTFLARCAEGRGLTTQEIDAIGQGRVWTGEQAKERGLVDALGGIDLAIRTAAELADLDQYQVTTVSNAKSLWEELLGTSLGEAKAALLKHTLGDEYAYFQTLERAKTRQGIQARLPYDMRPL